MPIPILSSSSFHRLHPPTKNRGRIRDLSNLCVVWRATQVWRKFGPLPHAPLYTGIAPAS